MEVMENQNEITKGIIETTMTIDKQSPELSKYIVEMPVTIPNVNKPEINETTLKDYQSSLDNLLKKYAQNHNNITK